ncbi:MAG: bifunctional oligoribonuclease/PAP phosphatase NrnA [Flammeovirgaceae bacterium]|nr:MAG: bifunctional oligoribonuclease/PAP phosphatase NrnA [Flammeovirgaceae bacterium]
MKNLSVFKQFMSQPRRVVIVTHHKPDADALGSSLGLWGYLINCGHTAQVITPSDYPAFLHWMPGNDNVLIDEEKNKQSIIRHFESAEIIFCLDFSSLNRVNNLGDAVRKSPGKKVLIDHHLEPEHFADFEQWDPKAASTAGLVYELIIELGHREKITPAIADCLYAGLMTDTGGFRHNNTRREEFMIASDLVSMGANPTKVSKLIYDTNTLDRLRLMGFVLSEKLIVLPEFNTAYMTLSQQELKRFGSQTGDTEGFVNYGLSIKGIRLSVMIYERSDEIKLSFRSLGNFSVNELARKYFEGGGHKNAAGGSSKLSLQATTQKFLALLPEYKPQLTAADDSEY